MTDPLCRDCVTLLYTNAVAMMSDDATTSGLAVCVRCDRNRVCFRFRPDINRSSRPPLCDGCPYRDIKKELDKIARAL